MGRDRGHTETGSNLMRYVLALILVAGLLVGCQSGDDPPTPASNPIPKATKTPTLSPTISLAEARAVADDAIEKSRQELLGTLGRADFDRFEAILLNTFQQVGYVTDDIHQEFWRLVEKGGLSQSALNNYRSGGAFDAVKYQSLFWQDVLLSLKTGRSEMSLERSKMEASMLTSGALNESRREATAVLLRDIAARRPVETPALGAKVIDEQDANDILAHLDQVERQIDLLFTPPKSGDTPTVTVSQPESQSAADGDQSQSPPGSWGSLSPAEQERFGEILLNTMSQPESLTEDIRLEFWRLMDKGGLTKETADAARKYLTLTSIAYETLWWQDVLTNLKTGRADISPDRREMEAFFLERGSLTQSQIDESSNLQKAIAEGRPVPMPGYDTPVIVDKEFAANKLEGFEYIERQLDLLFTRPD